MIDVTHSLQIGASARFVFPVGRPNWPLLVHKGDTTEIRGTRETAKLFNPTDRGTVPTRARARETAKLFTVFSTV